MSPTLKKKKIPFSIYNFLQFLVHVSPLARQFLRGVSCSLFSGPQLQSPRWSNVSHHHSSKLVLSGQQPKSSSLCVRVPIPSPLTFSSHLTLFQYFPFQVLSWTSLLPLSLSFSATSQVTQCQWFWLAAHLCPHKC